MVFILFIYVFIWLYYGGPLELPQPGVEPVPPAVWEYGVLTTGPSGKSFF